MNVGELIAELEQHDSETPVFVFDLEAVKVEVSEIVVDRLGDLVLS